MIDQQTATTSLSDIAAGHPWVAGLAVLAISMTVTAIAIPKVLSLSERCSIYDLPSQRKVHTNPVSRLGGMAFVPVIVLAVALAAAFDMGICGGAAFGGQSLRLLMGLAAMMVIYVMGLTDDICGVRYRTKLLLQAVAASFIAISGIALDNLHGVLGIHELHPIAGFLLTVMVVMLIINALNFMDGIDGLGAGLAMAALAPFALISMRAGDTASFAISAATAGALVPFMWHNVAGSHEKGNKIFMGDTGAMSLGLILSYLALTANSVEVPAGVDVSLAMSFAPLAVPCLDLTRVVLTRAFHGKNPFLPDRTHFHHKLIGLGWNQPAAAGFIVGLSLLFTVIANAMAGEIPALWILVCLSVIWCTANIILNIHLNRKTKKTTI